MTTVCLIEDEEKVAAFISKGLQEDAYEVSIAPTGTAGLKLVNSKTFDIIILDVMLPDMTGIDICRHLRAEKKQVPILMLTALDSIEDKVSGLQAGADDYLVKPFHFSELVARIEALLRRNRTAQHDDRLLTFSNLKLDTWSKSAERAGVPISLTAKEYTLLELFMRNPEKALSREYIAEKVWGIEFDTGTNFIDVYVNYLRKKIEKGFGSKLIHTVIGRGYMLKEEKTA
ncbi:response regulator transcription factor [Mucilaginibacter robiniae]|uniref:Response regulator transcription factor n=1 Tax=Mucilaginibacter robiniae TaxID=2728022 RepID=A0A7L5E9J6_9SPHI|nr:response regulator transcription factor [Mucilaginibacter robiniae]QJD97056.1 response regulator transcription factor [Mucilaginibacter robiniae]